jgi:hypothetical protein
MSMATESKPYLRASAAILLNSYPYVLQAFYNPVDLRLLRGDML